MKKLQVTTIIILLILSDVKTAQAQGMAVFDASSYSQMAAQIDALARDYQKQLEQLDQLNRQRLAMTGGRGAGNILNGALEQELREYLPHTWQETLNIMQASGLPSGAGSTQGLYADLLNSFSPVPGLEVYQSDPSGPFSKAWDRRTGTNYAAMAASEQAFNTIQGRIDTYEKLLEELNNTQDLKASVDLQARITAENGLILSEIMRLQAIGIQQSAAIENEGLTNKKRAHTANSFDPQKAGQAMMLP